jgi:hypothetical protein
MLRAYDKLVKQHDFQKGELVCVLRRPILIIHRTKGKFELKWEEPFIIEQVYMMWHISPRGSSGSSPHVSC